MDINARLKKAQERQKSETHLAAEEQAQREAARLKVENAQKEALDTHNAQFGIFERILRQQLPQKLLPGFDVAFQHKKINAKILRMFMSLEPKTPAVGDLLAYAQNIGADNPIGAIHIEICTAGAIAHPIGSIFMGKLVDNDKTVVEYELNEMNPYAPVLKQLLQDFMNRRYPE